jgi:hypothetical protein
MGLPGKFGQDAAYLNIGAGLYGEIFGFNNSLHIINIASEAF